ncbi:MAG: hypothetical protein IKN85_13365, partial [Oscillospiraceae bacterium]|nr:hypothetical protein [Oscillospiraceae bacterium]
MKKFAAAVLSACILSATAFSSFPDQTSAAKTKGDINGDGKVNAADFLSWLKYFHGDEKNGEVTLFDINEDGKINIIDYIS